MNRFLVWAEEQRQQCQRRRPYPWRVYPNHGRPSAKDSKTALPHDSSQRQNAHSASTVTLQNFSTFVQSGSRRENIVHEHEGLVFDGLGLSQLEGSGNVESAFSSRQPSLNLGSSDPKQQVR